MTRAYRAIFQSVTIVAGVILVGSFGFFSTAKAQEDTVIRVGIVTFLSGPAAASPGVPAGNGAQLIIDAINKGELPPPFDTRGLGGRQIEVVFVDESGGAVTQVTEFRNLVERRNVDLVVGYITTAACNAIAPVADELQTLTVFAVCATPIFETEEHEYVFQAINHATAFSVGLARYIHQYHADARTFAGINPNYSWGQDSWGTFISSLEALDPKIEIVGEWWPKLFAGQYGAEISALLATGPDVVHSAMWGGDMQAFVSQSAPRGLFERSRIVMAAGLHVLPLIGDRLPDGTIVSSLGPYGQFMPDSSISRWFVRAHGEQYGALSVAASAYAEAMLGVKAAFDKATANVGGAPSMADVIEAFSYLEWPGLTGTVRMANGNGHQAITGTAVGLSVYAPEEGQSIVTDIVRFDAACVNPPPGWKSLDWIEAGFPGAECD